MFRNLGLAATGSGAGDKKTMSPTLRTDIYAAIDQVKGWIAGPAGDGVSYQPLAVLIQKHFPKTEVRLDSIGKTESEIKEIVGGVTNMILEMSKWEGMAGGMAMRTWVDALVESHGRLPSGARKEAVASGISKGAIHHVDTSLVPSEFTTKIQIISSLKALMPKIYGSGTPQARQAEAELASKFI